MKIVKRSRDCASLAQVCLRKVLELTLARVACASSLRKHIIYARCACASLARVACATPCANSLREFFARLISPCVSCLRERLRKVDVLLTDT